MTEGNIVVKQIGKYFVKIDVNNNMICLDDVCLLCNTTSDVFIKDRYVDEYIYELVYKHHINYNRLINKIMATNITYITWVHPLIIMHIAKMFSRDICKDLFLISFNCVDNIFKPIKIFDTTNHI